MGVRSSSEKPAPSRQLGKELLAIVNCKGQFSKEDEDIARQAWECYDLNGNGLLERAEAEAFVRDIVAVHSARTQNGIPANLRNDAVKKAMHQIDKWGGKLTFEQFFGSFGNKLELGLDSDKKFTNGKIVEINGLEEMKRYNGVVGIYNGKDAKQKDRAKVRVNLGTRVETLLIKPENLRKAKRRVYLFRITQVRGSAKSCSLGFVTFNFMNWNQFIEKKSTSSGAVKMPLTVINPGGTCNRKGQLYSSYALRSMFITKNIHRKNSNTWRDHAWEATHQSTLVFTFDAQLGPLASYRFRTSRDAKWRDPVAWTVHTLDPNTGEWTLIDTANETWWKGARNTYYPLRKIEYKSNADQKGDFGPLAQQITADGTLEEAQKTTGSGSTPSAASAAPGGRMDTLDLPKMLPDLSRQQSFEPVTQKTTWQSVRFARQRSHERNKAGSAIVDDMLSENVMFVADKDTEMYLPRAFPEAVMVLKGKALILVSEYADLFLTRWNTQKKGKEMYGQIEKHCKQGKGAAWISAQVLKAMGEKMKKVFNVKPSMLLSDDSCATAASYLQMRVFLESLDIHFHALTGKYTSRQMKLRKMQEAEAKRLTVEAERKAKEVEEKKKKEEKTDASKGLPEVVKLKTTTAIKYGGNAGNDQLGGTGYGGNAGIDQKARKAIADKKEELKKTDRFSEMILTSMVALLSKIKTNGINTEKHKAELLVSGLNAYLANYLRSSFMQIAERKEVYLAVLKTCEALALGPGVEILDRDDEAGRSNVIELLANIQRQVSVYVTAGSAQKNTDKEMVAVASFAAEVDRITSAVMTQWKTFSKERKKRDKAAGQNNADGAAVSDSKVHMKRLENLSVNMVDLLGSKVKHIFKDEALRSTPMARVVTRLAQEIGSMMTGLPYGIYLAVDNTRMDIMRACIMAPGDAPYENGAFFFDIYITPEYPQKPPKCKIITTNRGTVRFNPNLYNNGKVCLSLLGTWSGPGWDPSYSNILQVLLSIQSMILGAPEPIVNEPGWARDAGSKRSKQYNSWLMTVVAKHAMYDHLHWLRLFLDPKAMEEEEKKKEARRQPNPGPPKFGKPTFTNNKKQPIHEPWECSQDPATKKWYFWHTETKTAQWGKPYKPVGSGAGVARSPLEGFTEILATHFWLKKEYLLRKQLPAWEAHIGQHAPKNAYGSMNKGSKDDIKKLREALEKLTEPEIEAEEEDEDEEEESDQDDF